MTITNEAGTSLTTLNIRGIQQVNPTKLVVIPLGAADKDAIQNFGLRNRVISLRGCACGLDEGVFLENLVGNTGSIGFTSDPGLIMWKTAYGLGDFNQDDFYFEDFFVYSGVTVYDNISVYFKSLNWRDAGSRPMEREFTMEVVEIR